VSDDESPLISIVIPHFNRAELLAETLASLHGQSYHRWEAIVVDDGSDPDQWESVQQLGDDKIRIIARHDGPKGPSKCRNLGIALSRGTHVVFVDSDDLVAPWCLEQRAATITERPEMGFWVFPVLLFQRRMGDSNICWNEFASGPDLRRFLQADPPWHTSSPIWQRSVLEELGGFNEAVMYGDDTDLHIRALLRNVPYNKSDSAIPDLFVRRDETPRITNTLTDSLIESRRARLREGSKALLGAERDSLAAWEGQYVVEAEFLLFNADVAGPAIKSVLADWRTYHRPGVLRRIVVQSYLSIALATRVRAYLVLRIARRIAMRLLPDEFFPRGGSFESTTLPEHVAARVRSRLADAISTS
jgi:hypothetical protein